MPNLLDERIHEHSLSFITFSIVCDICFEQQSEIYAVKLDGSETGDFSFSTVFLSYQNVENVFMKYVHWYSVYD